MNPYELHEPGGAITVSPAALTQIVVQAAELVDGVRVRRPKRGLELELADGRARVALALAARFGAVLPDLAREVQEHVSAALEGMCGVAVASIDVTVEELEDR